MDLHPDLRLLLRAADTSSTTVLVGTYASGKTRFAAAIAAMNGDCSYKGELPKGRFMDIVSDARMVLPAEFTTPRNPDPLYIYDTLDVSKDFQQDRPGGRILFCLQARRRVEKGVIPTLLDVSGEVPSMPNPSLVLGLTVNEQNRRIIHVHTTKLPLLANKDIDITDLIQTMNDWRRAAREGGDADRAAR